MKIDVFDFKNYNTIYGGQTALFILLAKSGHPDYKITNREKGIEISRPEIVDWFSFIKADEKRAPEQKHNHLYFKYVADVLPPFSNIDGQTSYYSSDDAPINFSEIDGIKIFTIGMLGAEFSVLRFHNSITNETYSRVLFFLKYLFSNLPEFLISHQTIPQPPYSIKPNLGILNQQLKLSETNETNPVQIQFKKLFENFRIPGFNV